MANRHTITEKEMADWMDAPTWRVAASSSSANSSRKFLEVNQFRNFRVRDHDDTVYLGEDLAAAVEAYNNAP